MSDLQKDVKQVSIYLPNEMLKEIQERARIEHRSLSAQIITILEETMAAQGARE